MLEGTGQPLYPALRFDDGSWYRYSTALGSRLGNEVPGRVIGFEDVIQKLWQARYQLSAGGFTPYAMFWA